MTNVFFSFIYHFDEKTQKYIYNCFLNIFRYHVFYDVDSSREEMIKNENDFEAKSEELLDKSRTMLDR